MKISKPRIVVSKCLEFDKCRYNGLSINDSIIRSLKDYVEFIPICPEVEIGLGTPRDPIRLIYKNKEIICIFQPHRISRLKNLHEEFSKSFKKADTVILCPIYKAGENIKLGFSYNNFAKKIIKNSKVKLILIKNNLDLVKYVKQNIYGNKIVIGMGAGSISNWIRDLPKYIK